jgi:hypothetical protein
MSWAMVAMGGASLLGGLLGGRSASKAAEVQSQAATQAAGATLQATRESNDLIRQMYMQNVLMQNPNLQAGQAGMSALMSGLGLGPLQASRATPTGDQQPTFTNAEGQTVDAQGNPVQPGMTGLPLGATQEQLDAAAGTMAPGFFTQEFSNEDFYRDPSYQFRLDEGMRALRAQAAAGGNRFGSQSLKDITNYAQGAASQEFGSAYDRFMRNRQAVYDRISNLSGLSPSTAQSVGGAGTTAATQIGSNLIGGTTAANQALMGGAAARAGGVVGSTNALVGGANQAMNNYWMQNYLRNPNRMPGGIYGTSSGE